jgi:hypothetical protein
MRRLAPVILALLAVAAPAATAHAGTVKVRSVSVARSATAGASTTVDVTVARRGRTRAAAATFYLSADAKRDARDARLKAPATVAKGRRSGKSRLTATLAIPAGQALGAYRVIACVGKSCAPSRPLAVTRTPVGTAQLVDQAVAAGKLSPEQGLVYRAFAAFGDRRLPAAYAGDDTAHEDTVMRDVAESWPKLSTAQRKAVEPFFTPPAARGSWAAGAARATAGKAPGAKPACETGRYAGPGWQSVARPDGHVRIWWHESNSARFAKRVRGLLAEAEDTAWRKLWEPFGREPLEDGGERCFHGGDAKLDIYVRNTVDGDTKGEAVPYPGPCSNVPGFIVFNAGRGDLPTRWELAHEITHAIQFAFPQRFCSSFSHFDEAVATWGGQYVYPRDDREHQFTWFTKEPSTPLADATYDGWVFPYALEQIYGPGVMQRIYEQGATKTAMNAIDAGVPGGLAKAYPEFAKLAWNHDPVKPSFWEWDGFDPVPEDTGGEIVPEQVDLGAAGQREVDLTPPLKPLSRAYKHLKFGPDTRAVTVSTPWDTDLHVEALLKLRDGTAKTVDLAKRRFAVFCPESPGQRVAEMVLVASDTSTFRTMPQDAPVRVAASNLTCTRYVGTVSGVEHRHTPNGNATEKWTATGLVFQHFPSGFEEEPDFLFKLVGGSVEWSYSGVISGCTYQAGPVTIPIKPDGSMGSLNVNSWHIYRKEMVRTYSALGWNLPIVNGTITCPETGTRPYTFRPHTFLQPGDPMQPKPDVLGNGVLEGTYTSDERSGGGYDVTYDWHLVPDG